VKLRGAVLYDGPSLLDGAPIVVIATGVTGKKSANSKTGGMVQTYIIRSDVHPVEAVRNGDDGSVCGAGDDACPLRPSVAGKGEAQCYVNKGFGPQSVYRAHSRGAYPTATPADVLDAADGRPIRFGTYGDPAAAPAEVWQALAAPGRTGYTHQWRNADVLQSLVMASVGTEAEARQAQADGWRTFRVRGPQEPLMPNEIACPASAESGRKTQCESCGLCNGKTSASDARKNIAIIDHGPTAARGTKAADGADGNLQQNGGK
jgi:hypothetical protein